MPETDLNEHPRVVGLTRVMREVSGLTDPAGVLHAFAPWLAVRLRRDFFVTVSRRGLRPGRYRLTRVIPGRPRFGEDAGLSDPWARWDELPEYEGGLIGEVLERSEPRLFRALDLAGDPVLGPLMGEASGRMRSLAAIPTFDGGAALNWSFVFCADERPYTPDEFEAAMLDINMLGTATRSLVARREAERLNARLSGQIEQIARIQRALLPDRSPSVPGFEIATSYLPSDDTGGDYYDFFSDASGRLGVLIADVSGHGAGAATVMAMLRAIIHCYENRGAIDPAGFARYCNEKLAGARLEGNFVTAFFCLIDPATGETWWCRAGHNPPRVRRADGTIEALSGEGTLPLGVLDELHAVTERGRLGPGDSLVLYTDGITELRGPGDELFGEARLDAALGACDGRPECVVDALHGAMFRFTGSMTRQDDQAIVVVRRTGGAS